MTTSTTTLVDDYLACWNETDPSARRERMAALFTPDATYVDPLAVAEGLDQLDATIGAVQRQFAGMVFTPHGDADAHHDQVRFGWGLGPAGAEPLVLGFDVVVTAADGRIEQVLGFLDRVPS
ncbi:nuclear transport factor 2 family protein [Jatrophihabitans fulvus]